MRRINGTGQNDLYGVASTRALEVSAANGLPPHTLMARAGRAVAQLTQALAPHARCIWVACGPGNNGGDGLVAAMHLHQWSQSTGGRPQVAVTLCGTREALPPDAARALSAALEEGVQLIDEPPADFDFAVDALLGIGCNRAPDAAIADQLRAMRDCGVPVLCVDVPSGLHTETGVWLGSPETAVPTSQASRFTLSLLTLKPGLFTGHGRDLAGEVWFDDLGCSPDDALPVLAQRFDPDRRQPSKGFRAHATHKGSYGEVLVIGGQDMSVNGSGMTGAAVLAARAALHSGAGRTYVALLGENEGRPDIRWDPVSPELMFRSMSVVLKSPLLEDACVVCGCGGGDAVAAVLPEVLHRARCLVLDADALNAVAHDPRFQKQLQQRHASGWTTVLTPHPLEAARLLATDTRQIMSDRLVTARQIADRFAAICVLKGSGSVVCAPGGIPSINGSGNAALASPGTGDVLAGMIGAALAPPGTNPESALDAVKRTVYRHGAIADQWVAQQGNAPLTAGLLATLA